MLAKYDALTTLLDHQMEGLLEDGFKRGVVYTSWWQNEYSSHESDQTLSGLIKPMGANWLQIIVTWYQATPSSTLIYPKETTATPSDEDLTHVINMAQSLGFEVMLKPHLDLEDNDSHWRGEISLGDDQAAWTAWFANYAAFICRYALLAQQTNTSSFVVGTELLGTTGQSDNWREVIKQVRSIFSGELTYAAHHDGEWNSIDWWDALDCIGVDAYFPLSAVDHPNVTQLKDAWLPIISKLEKHSETWKKAIIFTEIGYQSRLGASRTPWGVNSKRLDLQEQANCYQSLFEAFSDLKWWRGVFWWNWTTYFNQGGVHDVEYTANKKPAEDILRLHYGAPPRQDPSTLPLPPADESNLLNIYSQTTPAQGWQNWSWSATITSQDNVRTPSGQAATRVALYGWAGFSLHHNGIDTTPFYYVDIQMFIPADVYPPLIAYFHDADDKPMLEEVFPFEPRYVQGGLLATGQWLTIRIPLVELGVANSTITRFNFKNNSENLLDAFFLGEIKLLGMLR